MKKTLLFLFFPPPVRGLHPDLVVDLKVDPLLLEGLQGDLEAVQLGHPGVRVKADLGIYSRG